MSYNGRCGPLDENGYSYRSNLVGRRNPYLVTDSVFGNEYSANDGLPKYFLTKQVFEEVNEWLTDNVLQKIESIEEASEVDLISE
ncbi:MAG: hypothetical protein VX777_02035 [Chlamydiota bacterium]|nr:hypothetical protein [Chlamydiota bacterium]